MSDPFPPDDPREWLRRARSNLAYARVEEAAVLLEDRAFNAQQAAEKALKGVLLHHRIAIPFTHDLRELLNRLERAGVAIPPEISQADELTPYAVAARYPSEPGEALSREEFDRALELAKRVLQWADAVIQSS